MRRALIIAGYIGLNLLLFLAALLAFMYTDHVLISKVFVPSYLYAGVFWTTLLVSVGIIILLRKILPLKIAAGMIAVLMSLLCWLFFAIDSRFKAKGDYHPATVLSASWYEEGNKNRFVLRVFIDTFYDSKWRDIEVEPEQCFQFDIAEVRLDKGYFGTRILSNDVRITENDNCNLPISVFDSTGTSAYHTARGEKFFKMRCLDSAIVEYSKALQLDSLKPELYKWRAEAYFAKRLYRKALTDFYLATMRSVEASDSSFSDFVDTVNASEYVRLNLERIKRNDLSHVTEFASNIRHLERISDLGTYVFYMKYCADEIKQEERK